MTVTYTSHVATCRGFGCFWKLLVRWKGSIYKLIWPELILYTFLYYTASFLYRFALNDFHRRKFEKLSIHCQRFIDLIPVSFVLGFYVNIVIQRWWDQYKTIPWPDALSLFSSTNLHGQDNRSKLMRRTIVRYANLAMLITFTMISPAVKKRFPTRAHLVESGFMTENEKKIFDALDEKATHSKYWMPLVWAGSVVARARKEGRIRDDFAVKTLIDEINLLRGRCGRLLSYDTISIPLVYTQVVTLSVYSFFLGTIMARQFLDPSQKIEDHDIDFYVPIFTYLQFFFYMGWLKVAETLVNPFGEDDDDFEINWLVDRNLQVSYLIVDEMHAEHPELIQDMYWDEIVPQELPYTVASEQYRREAPQGSTSHITVPEADQDFLPMLEEEETEEEMDLPDEEKGKHTTKPRSAQSIRSRVGSALSSKKPSMLSLLMQRVRSGSQDNARRRSTKAMGSTVSIRNMRRRPSQLRSSSGMSSSTQITTQGSDSPTRKVTLVGENGTILNLSDSSLHPGSPPPVLDDDEDAGIQINFKRRDENGRVLSPEPVHNEEPAVEAPGMIPEVPSARASAKTRPSSSALQPSIVPLEEPDSQVIIGDEELKTITDDILKTVETTEEEQPPEATTKKSSVAALEPIVEEKKDSEDGSVTDLLDTERE